MVNDNKGKIDRRTVREARKEIGFGMGPQDGPRETKKRQRKLNTKKTQKDESLFKIQLREGPC